MKNDDIGKFGIIGAILFALGLAAYSSRNNNNVNQPRQYPSYGVPQRGFVANDTQIKKPGCGCSKKF